VLDLARKLVAAGYDPATPLEAWRGSTLCLTVGSIGNAARLRVTVDVRGSPIFTSTQGMAGAPLVRQNLMAVLATTIPSAKRDDNRGSRSSVPLNKDEHTSLASTEHRDQVKAATHDTPDEGGRP
jgi:hypothetical protein